MEASNDRNYSWDEALEMIDKGYKMRLPEWKGYWFKYKDENDVEKESPIIAMTKDGDTVYAWKDDYYKGRTDWQVAYGLGFDWALSAMKAGKYVRRKGWNGKGMYLWLMLPTRVPMDWIKEPGLKKAAEMNGGSIFCEPSIRIYTAQGTVCTGWKPSNLDMFADDWELAEEKTEKPSEYNPDELHFDTPETTAEWVKRMLKAGKKMRIKGQNGYTFSYDGRIASMVTDSGKTLTSVKPIDDLVIVDTEWEEAEAFNQPIDDFINNQITE